MPIRSTPTLLILHSRSYALFFRKKIYPLLMFAAHDCVFCRALNPKDTIAVSTLVVVLSGHMVTVSSAHTAAKIAICRTIMARKSPKNVSPTCLSYLGLLLCIPTSRKLEKYATEALNIATSRAKLRMFLTRIFIGIYWARRLSLMTKRPRMSTSQVPVTLLLVFQQMALHHSNAAKALLGPLSFSIIIFRRKHDSKRATTLVLVLFQDIKSLWT